MCAIKNNQAFMKWSFLRGERLLANEHFWFRHIKREEKFQNLVCTFFLKIWRKWPNFLIKIFLREEKWPFPPYFGFFGEILKMPKARPHLGFFEIWSKIRDFWGLLERKIFDTPKMSSRGLLGLFYGGNDQFSLWKNFLAEF